MEHAGERFTYNTPTTKEAYFYRDIFHKHFPQVSAAQTVRKWIPKWQENQDPSGRANAAHVQADTAIAKNNISV
ncbi:Asparagine synthetase B [glutamine-hydrolyzing] [compost metagenome]